MRKTRSRVAGIGVLVFLGAGCSGGLLKAQAAADLSCGEDQIQTEPQQAYVEKAVGCGKQSMYVYDASNKKWNSPLDRATFDLGCERAKLKTTVIDNSSVGVEGCGLKAVYVIKTTVTPQFGGLRTEHTWVANALPGDVKTPEKGSEPDAGAAEKKEPAPEKPAE